VEVFVCSAWLEGSLYHWGMDCQTKFRKTSESK
jgi:hypothetical protein